MRKYWVMLFCMLWMTTCWVFGNSLKKGLYFYSHEVDIKNRTSLVLNNGEPYSLQSKDLFSIEFDVYLRNVDDKFGYIFRIISDQDDNFDLITNNHEEVVFVTNKKDYQKKKVSFVEEKLNVKILFDKKNNKIVLYLDGEPIDCSQDLPKINSLLISFGECSVKSFIAHDVPPMILDNVVISKNDNIINKWAFNRYSGNVIYDSVEDRPAIFKTGKMLIENSLHWRKIGILETNLFPQITFDSIRNNVLVLNKTECISFAVESGETQSIPMKNIPVDNEVRLNRFIYDYSSNRLLSFALHAKKLDYYNEETHSWGELIQERSDYAYQNRYISLKDSSLYLFGGYGHHQYRSDLLKIDLKKQTWENFDLSSSIMPRYLAAMGGNAAGDKLYILGGRGAEMGIQELSPHNVYDLHEVDLNTMKSRLVYELPKDFSEKECVFSNNLIVDDKNHCLYVLAFPNIDYHSNAILKKLDLTNPVFETYGDTLKFNFHDITSFCDLYYSPSLSKLVAVLSSSEEAAKSKTCIYTLDFPPLKKSDVYRKYDQEAKSILSVILVAVSTLILLLSIRIYFRYRKNKKQTEPNPEIATGAEIEGKHDDLEEIQVEDPKTTSPEETFYKRNKSSILFLGGFQVFDKSGKDTTKDFSPILKYLLILIVLYTHKTQKGISSIKLEEILWPGKTDEAARNNRNVNLRKLRMLLETIGDYEIINKNSYWSISLSDDILSDYIEIFRLIETVKENNSVQSEEFGRLLELLSYGEILPNIQNEWVDPFKSDFSNDVIDLLMQVLEVNMDEEAIFNNYSIFLKIADTISTFDPINEDAVAVKCRVLYKIGKKGPAQKVYNSFIRDYKMLLNEDYKMSLKELLNKKIE